MPGRWLGLPGGIGGATGETVVAATESCAVLVAPWLVEHALARQMSDNSEMIPKDFIRRLL